MTYNLCNPLCLPPGKGWNKLRLVAIVDFLDVDGNKCKQEYTNDYDLYSLLDSIAYNLTDADNFPKTSNKVVPGMNGIIDTSKEISITIHPQIME